MRFSIDHDYHIHSYLSLCSNDAEQNPENILKFAESNGYKEICITDHFWDSSVKGASENEWYGIQNFKHISSILPLPKNENIKFYFGCETELDKYMTLGLSDNSIDKFDFIIIPTTHLHMNNFTIDEIDSSVEKRAELYVKRLDKVLDMDLPFNKIGIAHLTCPLLAPESWESHLAVLDLISDDVFGELFTKLKDKGAGFELNFTPEKYNNEDLGRVLRPYKIAKNVGCEFYLGSDAHHPSGLSNSVSRAEKIISLLELKEDDKFRFYK